MPRRCSPTSLTFTSLYSGMTCALAGLIHISQEVDLEKQVTEFQSQTSTHHVQKLKCTSNTRPTYPILQPILAQRYIFETRGAPSRILLCQVSGELQRLLAFRLDLSSPSACADSTNSDLERRFTFPENSVGRECLVRLLHNMAGQDLNVTSLQSGAGAQPLVLS